MLKKLNGVVFLGAPHYSWIYFIICLIYNALLKNKVFKNKRCFVKIKTTKWPKWSMARQAYLIHKHIICDYILI